MKCTNCGSNDIVYDVRPVDKADNNFKSDLTVEVYENPEAWIFKNPQEGKLRANICVECGYVMWFVSRSDAKRLQKYQKKNT